MAIGAYSTIQYHRHSGTHTHIDRGTYQAAYHTAQHMKMLTHSYALW